MAGTIQSQPNQPITLTIERILNTGHLTRLEHLHLVTTILSDYKVTDEERSQINLVLDELQVGHLQFRE